jgi:hypothetical protein
VVSCPLSQAAIQTAIAETSTAELPTITKTPQISPTPRISPEIISYISTMNAQEKSLEDALDKVQSYIDQIGPNTSVILDKNWQTGIAIALAGVKFNGDALSHADNVPPQLDIADRWFKMAGNEAQSLADNLSTGIDNFDTEKMNASQENAINIARYLSNANDEMNKVVP